MTTSYAVIDRDMQTIGRVHRVFDGWVFVPATTVRKSSRKHHPSPDSAIPAWAKRLGAKIV